MSNLVCLIFECRDNNAIQPMSTKGITIKCVISGGYCHCKAFIGIRFHEPGILPFLKLELVALWREVSFSVLTIICKKEYTRREVVWEVIGV